MVIHYLNVVRIFAPPPKANSILVVDPDAVLPGAVAFQPLQAVARRHLQIAPLARTIQLRQLAKRHALNLRRQTVVPTPLPQTFGFPTGETGNH
jgi:hypothetical protein